MNKRSSFLTKAGIIAALYAVLTMLSTFLGISSGFIQFRLSESLCILAAFMPEAIPGLSLGCLIANILSGLNLADIIFGTLATFLGAIGTWHFRKNRILASLSPIITNSLIIPPLLMISYGVNHAYFLIALSIFLSECISAGLLGQIVYETYKKTSK